MNRNAPATQPRAKIGHRTWNRILAVWLIFAIAFGTQTAIQPSSARAATNTLTLSVVSARTEPRAFGGAGVTMGDAITQFKYIINVDNTGTTEQRTPGDGCSPESAGYPASCNWISIAGAAPWSSIYTQGDQNDIAAGINLPDGRYLISVIADGYKLDGVHFSVPLADPGLVTVELQPWPLPEATIRAWVFEDISPTNSAPDAPIEHGLPGFVGHIADYIGEVTTDVYGNPLCTRYEGEDPVTFEIPAGALDAEGLPVPVPGTGGQCVSDAEGMLAIPHVGPNRYALSAVPPDGQTWIQTTTLEGNHDWDAWVMEGATGYDTEFVVAGEPFPATFFGFVRPTPMPASSATGEIKGVVMAAKVYVPTTGGVALPGTIWGGMAGARLDHPIDGPWISLSDLGNGDTSIYVGQGNPDGSFSIPNVPDGNYMLSYWDEPQDYILDLLNVTVANGEVVDMGVLPLTGWWTFIDGYVFNDLNRNGIKDPGEPGLANFPVALKKRENSMMDRGSVLVTTDANGYYFMESAYPMTQWLVMEAYSDLYYTTGVTYQADNQPTPTTLLGAGVDVSVLPIIGLSGRLDWGVHAYDPTGATCSPAGSYQNCLDPRNGGIVGTVSYDTTRNELDPRYAAVEDWQPGVPDLTVNLYSPVTCGTNPGAPCDLTGRYELALDGAFARGKLLNTYLTETWQRPGANGDGICIPRDVNGDPLTYPTGQQVTSSDADCLEGPLMGVQFQNGFSTVDGNYGFVDGCFGVGGFDPQAGGCANGAEPTPLTPGDYLVDVVLPTEGDVYGPQAVNPARPLLQVTKEEDINIFNGDQFVPQIPPPQCAGPLHTVDVVNDPGGVDNYPAVVGDGGVTNDLPVGVTVPASTPVENQPFADGGGSVYEGKQTALCSTKLVRVSNGRSIAPTFNVFTDVPIPGRFWGLIVDDLNFSTDPKSLLYGEKAGVPFAPVGIYDYTNRLVATVESDYNGLFDVLLPSTNRINCPTPSGVCANLYRFVGNDPGTPGQLNPNYNPQFRTIAAEFEAIPGLIVPADLAPTQMGVTIQLPGSQFNAPVACLLDSATPQLFAVSKPYADLRVASSDSFTISGLGFGATQGTGQVTLDGTALPATSWSDTQIAVNVPPSTPRGPHQLKVTANNGQSTVNGLTFHVLGNATSPAFPANGTLDNFNRGNNFNSFGSSWVADTLFNLSAFNVVNNEARVRTGNNVYDAWWGSTSSTVYGANQEAYFTFTQVSNQSGANEQGLLLKFSGALAPGLTNANWIEVAYNNNPANTVRIRTKSAGSGTITTQATLTGVSFAANDQIGARALDDGTIIVYKNGAEIGRTTVASTAAWTGRIGVRFEGTGTTNASQARFDNFGGGTLTISAGASYLPNLYEVGPGKTYQPLPYNPQGGPVSHAIQDALDAAAASPGDDLVVVYPGLVQGDRINPRGSYYENPIIYAPVKLQGVGPGGVYANGTPVPGSIIDGSAFGGDTPQADDWRARIASLNWVGNQNPYEGQTIYLLAQSETQYSGTFKAAIDGFDLRGGDQQGFPTNLNQIGGLPTGLPPTAVTQGGAIFANAYVRFLQITNNVVQNNGGSYGTIRIGTPDLPAPDTNQHNEDVRIANNRITANGGTNLAGGIGLFAGSDRYEVAGNDICGNFSAEYGGGLSVYGFSPGGKIHDNRIYFNRSYDEGGGIMIAGQLPADPATLSPGSGAVDIYNNLIQGNLANDDGGGIRFLMAGNFPMNVFNNMIVNNVSTHEGGGIGINDAPDVRAYNNTIMKNTTTATAITSNGLPAPAGLSTSANSDLLQASLPGGSPTFSDPLMFNNIFWDNRAGARGGGTVTGVGIAGDPTPINYWDVGVADGSGLVSPTNTILQTTTGSAPSGSNLSLDPLVITPYDTSVAFSPWRTNPNFIDAFLVATDLPPNLLGNYHIPDTSPARDAGAASKLLGLLNISAPLFDYDNQVRPSDAGYEIGADELPGAAQPPVVAFPKATLLDDFNRANGGLGSNWAGNGNTTSIFRIQGGPAAGNVQVRGTGNTWWNPASFGANQEVFYTFAKVASGNTEQGMFLKLNGGSPDGLLASLIEVTYNAASNTVIVRTRAVLQGWITRATFTGVSFAANDQFGARALSDGTVTVFKNGVQIGIVNVTSGVNPWPAALAQGNGKIGVRFNGTTSGNDARFDNFGGGNMP